MRVFILAAVALTALPAFAQDLEEGAAAFAAHCAACHGVAGTGNGPMAQLLTVRPADLTGLAARNGGVFPTARVMERIDGTTEVLAHGGSMPLFGMLMQGPSAVIVAPDGSDVVAPEAIVNIAGWLQGAQE